MANDYYTPGSLTRNTLARAAAPTSQWDAIEAGFDKLPTETNGKEGKVHYAVDSGVADAYVASLPHAPSAYSDGLLVNLKIGNTNTGASTLNLNALGTTSIKRNDGSALEASDLLAGTVVPLRHNGTEFRIVGLAPGSQVAAAASASAAATSASAASSSASSSASSASASAASETAAAASASAAAASAALIDDWGYENEYNAGTSYDKNNIVFHASTGCSYISLQDANLGNTPAYNGGAGTAFWGVMAAKGDTGAGTGDLLAANNLSDVASAATAFGNIKQAASATATGVVELATDAEAQAKSDTGRALVPANLAALAASETFAGLVERATQAEAETGTDTTRYTTPATVKAEIQMGGYTVTGTMTFNGLVTLGANLQMADNEILRPQIRDYALPVTADATFTGAETIDLENGNVHELTLTGDVSGITISNWPVSGNEGRLTLYIHQDSTARTITWPAAVKWTDGAAPDLSTVSKTYMVVLTTIDGGTTIQGHLAGGPYS